MGAQSCTPQHIQAAGSAAVRGSEVSSGNPFPSVKQGRAHSPLRSCRVSAVPLVQTVCSHHRRKKKKVWGKRTSKSLFEKVPLRGAKY